MTGSGQIIYFHGMPGGPDEIALFGKGFSSSTSDFHVLDRVSAYNGLHFIETFQIRISSGNMEVVAVIMPMLDPS